MILKDFLPNPALNEFIQCYRIVHFETKQIQVLPVKVYPPKPEECLHFFLREGESVQLGNSLEKASHFPIVCVGQQTSVISRYLLGNKFITFNIIFQPTALFRLTGIPSFELTNKYVDAESIFAKRIRKVHEQLQDTQDHNNMVLIADRFINTLVSNAPKNGHLLDAVSRLMLRSGGNRSLNWLAKESCLSPKQFKRKFNERAGVNPKTYSRIIRFTKAFNIKNAYPHLDWLRIAVECDYFDYQHLVKDYKDFTGQTPNKFHLLENNSPESSLGLTGEIYKSRAKLAMLAI